MVSQQCEAFLFSASASILVGESRISRAARELGRRTMLPSDMRNTWLVVVALVGCDKSARDPTSPAAVDPWAGGGQAQPQAAPDPNAPDPSAQAASPQP